MKFVSSAVAAACFFDLALAQISGQATCYFANGTALPKTPAYLEYQACPGSSICCGLNRSNPSNGDPADGFTKDECLPNGLCQNRETVNGIGKVSYWVDFCTNSDVSATGCLDVCQQTKNVFGNTPMTPCDGTATSDRWCCGTANDCCTSNVGVVRLAQVLGGSLSSALSTSTRTSSTLSSAAPTASTSATSATPSTSLATSTDASSTPTSTAASTAPTSSNSSPSGGAIAGIVIGALAGLFLIAAAIFFARRAAMWKKKASAVPETGAVPPYAQHTNEYGHSAAGGYDAPAYGKQVYGYHSEIDGGTAAQELPAETTGGELPTNAPKRGV